MNTQTYRKPSIWVLLALVVMLALTLASTSFADDVTGEATITGGTLTMSTTDNPAFGAITLNGTNQILTDSIGISVNDFTGSGDGWKLQITSTAFTDGSHPLANSAMTVESVGVACDVGTCTNPTNGIGYPLTVPADAVAPAAVNFFNSAVDTGMGDFTVTPTFEIAAPAATYAGVYTSTVTLTVATAP